VALKVLVVEDHAPTLEFFQEVLRSLDAEVRAFSDSSKAAAAAETEQFDGIFLDLQMPGLNGFELSSRIRQSPWNKSTPIIIITGHENPQSAMKEAFNLGSTFFLQKPVDRYKLVSLFRSARGQMDRQRQRFARVRLKVEVLCTAPAKSFQAESVNFSTGGMLVQGGAFLQPGSRVELTFKLPGQRDSIRVTASVVRVDDRGRMGLRFLNVSSKHSEALRELVEREADS
jgi:uncharacterized protein (TIGR02266 family)